MHSHFFVETEKNSLTEIFLLSADIRSCSKSAYCRPVSPTDHPMIVSLVNVTEV